MNKLIAIVSLVTVLCLVNWSIISKEKHLEDGRVVYLKLAPVDPRSLMQGDYVALRFAIADEVYKALPKVRASRRWRHDVAAGDGSVVVTLDQQNVVTFSRLDNGQKLSERETLIRYRVRNGGVKFATNAFFFQEGQAKTYEAARYGQFRVDDKGDVLLVAMYDKDLNKLEQGVKAASN
ncbi:MAG: putative membrane-anchored protein [Desulforhopalus sp.]|jgi:uncharacterized membrane-anchored protein